MSKWFIACASLFMACSSPTATDDAGTPRSENTAEPVSALLPPYPDYQGHRGCRGLMPENTIPAFIKALDLGVTTLEMDVVITADGETVLSHEPWFSHEICLDPSGNEIAASEEMEHRIYGMTYEEVLRYDCGSKVHPRFPDQEKLKVHKPLLKQVIDAAETHAKAMGREAPFYNIETKCLPQGDGWMHPKPAEFAEAVVEVVEAMGITERTTIQSFDVRTLQHLEGKYPGLRLALLVENNEGPSANLDKLGFTPHIYSPDYTLVNAELVSFCKKQGMQLIPWTVNDTETMRSLLDMGVNGIISDFPDRFSPLR